MSKTIFLDIDGCILEHQGSLSKQMTQEPKILPGVIEVINEWELKGYKIILTTGRKEPMRKRTERLLYYYGIFYEQLIMGVGRGERVIINDKKENHDGKVASAIELKRNEGLEHLKGVL